MPLQVPFGLSPLAGDCCCFLVILISSVERDCGVGVDDRPYSSVRLSRLYSALLGKDDARSPWTLLSERVSFPGVAKRLIA